MKGIYGILGPKQRWYVGQAYHMRERISQHISDLRRGNHHSPRLQASWNKYGEDYFIFFELELCHEYDLTAQEQFWMNKLDSLATGYNAMPASSGFTSESIRALWANPDSAARMSKGNGPASDKTKQAMREGHMPRRIAARDAKITTFLAQHPNIIYVQLSYAHHCAMLEDAQRG